jgi:putative membrane protein
MAYLYLKALHIIFIVTWFAGLFYMPRFFIYNTEANEKDPLTRKVLQDQFAVMMKRLWYGITWPSAILTLFFGIWVLMESGLYSILLKPEGSWLTVKLVFVILLYAYHFSIQHIMKQELRGHYRYSSMQLRMWNEVATIFLVAVVLLVVVKQNISLLWGLLGLLLFVLLLVAAIRIYKIFRTGKK